MLSITREQIEAEITAINEYKRETLDKLRLEFDSNDSMANSTSVLGQAGSMVGATDAHIKFWESLLKYVEAE